MSAARDSAFLRGQLASVGIILDTPSGPSSPIRAAEVEPAPVDRELVRRILVSAGAPDRDIEWLTASCPSVDDALTYQPPEEL